MIYLLLLFFAIFITFLLLLFLFVFFSLPFYLSVYTAVSLLLLMIVNIFILFYVIFSSFKLIGLALQSLCVALDSLPRTKFFQSYILVLYLTLQYSTV